MHTGKILDRIKNFDVIECEECGFIHISPVPSMEELRKVYNEEYYSIEKPLYLEHTKEDLDWWNLVYSERYEMFEKHLSAERRSILDVGSGPGYFLLHGKRRGWQTLGIEPSKQAASHSRELGLDIEDDFLDERTVKKIGTFDVVHMNDVLEHIPDPFSMLKMTHRLLRSDGLIYVVVPNDYNPIQYALRTSCNFRPWWVAPPHHINYFNFQSLGRLLGRTGFRVIWQEATFPIDMFLLMGENYIGDNELGRKCHGRRKLFEENLARAGLSGIKRRLYRALSDIGIGREIVILGRKQ
jgi:SAM-dependent methyltransferase